MWQSLSIKPFYIYNIILFVTFCFIVNPTNDLYILNYLFYCFFHFLLIYLALYYYRISLYIIYFFYGLCIDVLWFNEIGPHLLIFLLVLLLLNFINKYLYNFSSFKIYLFLLFLQISMIFLELLVLNMLFNYQANLNLTIKIIFISLILSYPIFLLFSKIDRIK